MLGARVTGRNAGLRAVDRVQEHNRKLRESRQRDLAHELQEGAKYYAEAIGREMYGDGRWTREDVRKGIETRWI